MIVQPNFVLKIIENTIEFKILKFSHSGTKL